MAGVGEDVLVGDDSEAWVVQVQPVWDLAICHQEDSPDPRRKLLQGTQGVSQLLASTEEWVRER